MVGRAPFVPPRVRQPDVGAVLMVDPSLFTAPYDAALSHGLESRGMAVRWATRAMRAGEEDELGMQRRLPIFYRWTDGPRRRVGRAWRAVKGAEHFMGLRALTRLAREARFDVVHFQWAVLPAFDVRAIRELRRDRPVVLTVHDTTLFNGKAVAPAQTNGFDRLLVAVDRLIVHTEAGRKALIERGIDADRIAVVPHGLLGNRDPAGETDTSLPPEPQAGARWRIVQFGKMQDYKGVDLLVEALGLLPPEARARLSVVVAGEPLIDLEPLRARARVLGIDERTLEFRAHRHSEAEMDAVLGGADAFVFPYRAIEASGVLFLVARRGRWVVASDLGAFSGLVGRDDRAGALVPPGDAAALAAALTGSIGRVPTRELAAGVPDWTEIGRMTRDVYAEATHAWRARAA